MRKAVLIACVVVILGVLSYFIGVDSIKPVISPVYSSPQPIEALILSPVITEEPVATPLTINQDSAKLWLEVQQFRQRNKLRQYHENQLLCEYAEKRANDMFNGFTHDDFYKSSQNLMDRGKFYQVSENLAYSNDPNEDLLDGWLHSPDHRAALFKDYTESCIKCSGIYCVQEFAKY